MFFLAGGVGDRRKKHQGNLERYYSTVMTKRWPLEPDPLYLNPSSALGKLLNLFIPQFSTLESGRNNTTDLLELLKEFHELILIKCFKSILE